MNVTELSRLDTDLIRMPPDNRRVQALAAKNSRQSSSIHTYTCARRRRTPALETDVCRNRGRYIDRLQFVDFQTDRSWTNLSRLAVSLNRGGEKDLRT